MGRLDSDTTFNGTITINRQSGTVLTLPTADTYLRKNIELSLVVREGSVVVDTISVNTNGLVTASASVSAGYVDTITLSDTLQLQTKAAQTYVPSISDQTIASGQYLTGVQTIRGDANLTAANIARGVTIFGVTGSHYGGTDTSDATAHASDLLVGQTAYVNGNKVTGEMPNRGSVSGVISTADGAYSIQKGYHNGNGSVSIDAAEQAKIVPDNIRAGVSILGVSGTLVNGTASVYDGKYTVTVN